MVVILVGVTIILLVSADLVLRWRIARQKKAPAPLPDAVLDLLLPALQPSHFSLPGGLFFHRGHTWANLLYSGEVKVGLDDFLQRLLGRIDDIMLPPVGVTVRAGEPFVTIRQNGRTATLQAPLNGEVCAVNGELAKNPNLLKRDPYTGGWFVALRPTALAADLSRMNVGGDAFGWLQREVTRFQRFLADSLRTERHPLVGLTAADGGVHADSLLEHADDDTWRRFQKEFLGT
ncbi:MAG TPA: glycine cleavage system protein H [Candidatus Acidoferrum sp.]|nr:glycine cleavage system protein H [Candidatus Acidoferrum sp.]